MLLHVGRDGIRLLKNSAVHLKDVYRDEFRVILSASKRNTFVLHVREGASLPLAASHAYERDLLALVARAFWALSRASNSLQGKYTSRPRGV